MARETLDTVLISNESLAADFSTGGLDVSQYLGYMIQMNFTAGDATGTMVLEVSADNINWNLEPGSAKTFDASSTVTESWEVRQIFHHYVRVSVANVSGTTGTFTLLAHLVRDVK